MHVIHNISYGNNVLDLYLPYWSKKPWPCVFNVHGGGWSQGDEDSGPALEHALKLVDAHNIAVASIRYRLAPTNKWPIQLQDVLEAINFIKHSIYANYLSGKFGIIGASAGAHIAAMVNNIGYYTHNKQILPAVLLYGPYDLNKFLTENPVIANQFIPGCFGANPHPRESPINRLTNPTKEIPTLIIHGKKDIAVNYTQSVNYHNTKENSELILVNNADHCLTGASQGDKIMVDNKIAEFYNINLKG